MAISNNSTGLRPGVCTSSTRPTAPYEGQHIYETDTDIEYVWSGSAWVVNYVSAASPAFTGTPTAPTASAGTNTTQLATTAFANTAGGLVYITGGAVSGASTNFVGCFTSTYDNYRIVCSNIDQTVGWFAARMLVGTSVTVDSYYSALSGRTSGNTIVGDVTSNTSFITLAYAHQSGYKTWCAYDIFTPQKAMITGGMGGYGGINVAAGTYNFYQGGFSHNSNSVQFSGIQFLTTGSGNISGDVRIYGYRNS